jgi:methionine sulfoxide reductase heme-binding subunit
MLSNIFRFLLLVPGFYWTYLILFSDLGADPAKNLNHKAGEIALYYILLNLLLGILIGFKVKIPIKLRFLLLNRRYLGVLSFLVLVFHVFLYFAMESFEAQAIEQIFTKNYLIFGSLAFSILLILAITSNDFSVRRLTNKVWKRLHRFIYLASLFFSIHILLIEKADLIKYGLILGMLWLLQISRFLFSFWPKKERSI